MALFGKSSRGSHDARSQTDSSLSEASARQREAAYAQRQREVQAAQQAQAAQAAQAQRAAQAQQAAQTQQTAQRRQAASGQTGDVRGSQRMDERIPRMQGNPQATQRQARVAQTGAMPRRGNAAASQRMQAVGNDALAGMAPATEATGSYADLSSSETGRQKLGAVVISLREVTKIYPAQPDRPALDKITVDIHAGEFLFLVGHSGSGKSTFIRMLNREIVPTSGELIVAGENLRTMKNWRVPYLRRNVGCVFQDFKLLPNKTAFENVAFALEVIGKSKHVIKTQVPEVLRLVGLEEKMDKMPDQLSGGEQQRVSIARSIVNRPPILICDEPTGNLDPQTSLGIMRLLERINRTGTTILVATHDREMVDQMRRRVLALENGVLVRDQKKGVYGYDV